MLNGIPGFSDIRCRPAVREQPSEMQQTDIILTLTPHIVRVSISPKQTCAVRLGPTSATPRSRKSWRHAGRAARGRSTTRTTPPPHRRKACPRPRRAAAIPQRCRARFWNALPFASDAPKSALGAFSLPIGECRLAGADCALTSGRAAAQPMRRDAPERWLLHHPQSTVIIRNLHMQSPIP